MRVIAIMVLLCASVSASEITEAIGQLGAGKFADREAGIQHLVSLAQADSNGVLQECVRMYQQTNDPEVKVRLRTAMQQIVDKYLYRAPRGFLGIQMGLQGGGGGIVIQGGGRLVINGVTITSTSGIWVTSVISNSAAEKAGLRANDFIVAIDGREGVKTPEFIKYVQSKRPGTVVKLNVVRGEATNAVGVTLGELPQEQRDQILTEQGGREFFKDWLRGQTGGVATNSVPSEKK